MNKARKELELVEWELWKALCRALQVAGVVTERDLESPAVARDTEGQKLLAIIRAWGAAVREWARKSGGTAYGNGDSPQPIRRFNHKWERKPDWKSEVYQCLKCGLQKSKRQRFPRGGFRWVYAYDGIRLGIVMRECKVPTVAEVPLSGPGDI